MKPHQELARLRRAVDAQNIALRDAVLARLEVVERIARLKTTAALPAVDPRREAAMRKAVLRGLRGRSRRIVAAVFDAVVAACRETVVALTRRRRAVRRVASRPPRNAPTRR